MGAPGPRVCFAGPNTSAETERTGPALPSVSDAVNRDAQSLPGGGNEAYLRRVITVVRLARVLLILLLATFALSSVIGVGSSETGAVEKVALLALLVGCVGLAAKVSVLAGWAQERLQRH